DSKSNEETTYGTKEPITFSVLYCDSGLGSADDKFQSPVSKKITELTGVTLSKEYVVGDPKQKLALLASSGEYPDMIYTMEFSNVIMDAGGFIPLDKMIEEKGVNTKEVYGDYINRLRWSSEDPFIYMMGNNTVNEELLQPEFGFQLQMTALKELGYPKMETLQDYENVIKTYKEKYPTIDGKPTIGLSLLADDWRIKISTTNPAAYSTGKPDDGEWYYDIKEDKAVLHLTTKEEKEYFRWLNHINDIGLLDPESFIQKFDQYEAKIADGRVIGLIDSKWEYGTAEQTLVAAGKPERTYTMLPLVMDNKTQKYAAFRPLSFSGGYGIGITTSCKDPQRAFEYLDWCSSKESQLLRNWGIEGVHYDVVDGKRTFKPDVFKKWCSDPNFSKETGIGVNGYPWPGYGLCAKAENDDYWHPMSEEIVRQAYTKPEIETLDAYGAKLWKDLYPTKDNFQANPYGELWKITLPGDSEGNLILRKYDELTARTIPEAIMAKPQDFDKVWEKYQADLVDIGIDKLTQEFNGIMQKQKKLWKK
ncbi:MAG: ABC transporter substrate-binding protein, partial [Oscillospiraceae bacterium]